MDIVIKLRFKKETINYILYSDTVMNLVLEFLIKASFVDNKRYVLSLSEMGRQLLMKAEKLQDLQE